MTDRRVISGITLVVLVGLLAAGAVYGWNALFSPVSDGTNAGSCTRGVVKRGDTIRTRDVTVSVFNAGSTSGAADRTLTELAARGFVRGDVGNAPDRAEVRKVQVWTRTKNDAAARLVARQFGKNTLVRRVRSNLGAGVDVIVGDGLGRLVDAPRSIRARTTQRTC